VIQSSFGSPSQSESADRSRTCNPCRPWIVPLPQILPRSILGKSRRRPGSISSRSAELPESDWRCLNRSAIARIIAAVIQCHVQVPVIVKICCRQSSDRHRPHEIRPKRFRDLLKQTLPLISKHQQRFFVRDLTVLLICDFFSSTALDFSPLYRVRSASDSANCNSCCLDAAGMGSF
jgi:hypothetical protein